MPVLATTLMGGLLVLAAYAGPSLLALAVVALTAVFAYGLLASGGLPEQGLAGALVVLTAAGAALSVLASEAEAGAETSFAPVLRAVGPAMVAVLLVVLARPRARERAVEWLALTGAGVVVAALAASAVALGRLSDRGPELIAITAAAAVVGAAAAVPPAHRLGRWLWPLGWVAAGLAAAFVVPIGLVDRDDRLVVAVAAAIAAGAAAAAVGVGAPADRAAVPRSPRAALVATVAFAVAAPVAATTVRVLLA